MAASLVGDLSCPLCIELFSDPVLLSCGHSFCRLCINDHWILNNSRRCYVCRQVSPQPLVSNLSLRNNYDGTINRAKYTLPDAVALIDVPKYLGNLMYQLWKKMKDVCPYYPVILNPNTSSPNVMSVSDDLTSVTSSRPQPKALPLHRNRVVLGSVGYANGVHSWDIEVGNSRHWTLGVCLGSVERSFVQPLTPENGFWGLRRDGDLYILMDTGMSRLNVKRNPEVIRVKIDDFPFDHNDLFLIFQNQKHWRKVSFSDARSDSFLAGFTRVPLEKELFPFVIPKDQSVPLRVVPAKVIVTVEQKLLFTERVLILILGVFVVVIVMILSWAIKQMNF